MKFKNREEQRKVKEMMAAFLLPMTEYCNDEIKECISITMQILQETPVEDTDKQSFSDNTHNTKKERPYIYDETIPQ